MKKIGSVGYPFIAIGIAFVAIGFSGRKALFVIGLTFLIIGFVLLRSRAR